MDLLYAAVIGNSLQALHPNSIDALFIFGMCLLLIALEDFFLYYADVAPENPASEGVSFFGMLSEIAILTAWFFAFQTFARDSWTFVIYLMVFFGLKIIAGFLNCLVSKNLWSLKFFRELMFFISVGVLSWILWTPPRYGALTFRQSAGSDRRMLVCADAGLVGTYGNLPAQRTPAHGRASRNVRALAG